MNNSFPHANTQMIIERLAHADARTRSWDNLEHSLFDSIMTRMNNFGFVASTNINSLAFDPMWLRRAVEYMCHD